jgi:hypothetical protein
VIERASVVGHRPLPDPRLIHATAHLIGSPGGPQSACAAGSLTCGDVSVAVGQGVSKWAPIAVKTSCQTRVGIPAVAVPSGAASQTLHGPFEYATGRP